MPTYGLTPTGFNPKPYEVIKQELDAAFKNAYGDNVGSEPDGSIPAESRMGQEIGTMADRFTQLWEIAQAVSSANDPDKATGAALDAVAALTGTIRNGERESTATVTATGVPGTLLVAGRVVSAVGSKTRFDTLAGVVLVSLPVWTPATAYVVGNRVTNAGRAYLCDVAGTSAGSGGPSTTGDAVLDNSVTWRYLGEGTAAGDVAVEAEVAGAFAAVSGTLTVIESPVDGWKSVTNILDAVVGAAVEQDGSLRIRREDELQAGAFGTVDAIRANLLQVGRGTPNPVTACTVFENPLSVTSVDGLPPHSVECLVLGGVDQDIFAMILRSKDAGIEAHGNTVGSAADSAGIPHVIKFTRPTEILIWLELDVQKSADDFPIDGVAQIKLAIVTNLGGYSFGKNVTSWGVGASIKDVPGVLNVTQIRLGITPFPFGTADIPIGIREIARFDTSRIVVNVVDAIP